MKIELEVQLINVTNHLSAELGDKLMIYGNQVIGKAPKVNPNIKPSGKPDIFTIQKLLQESFPLGMTCHAINKALGVTDLRQKEQMSQFLNRAYKQNQIQCLHPSARYKVYICDPGLKEKAKAEDHVK